MQLSKRTITCVLVAGAVLYFLSSLRTFVTANVSSTVQVQERTIKHNSYKDEPIKIEAIKVKGVPRGLQQKFLAEDDWLRGFSMRFKNTSPRSIVYLEIDLYFPRGASSSEPMTAYPLTYGTMSSLQSSVPNAPPFLPKNSKVEVSLSESDATNIQQVLNASNYPVSVKEIEILVNEIYFDDGTKWVGGMLYRRSSQDPNEWTPVIPISRQKNSANPRTVKAALAKSSKPQIQCSFYSGSYPLICNSYGCSVTEERMFSNAADGANALRYVNLPCRYGGAGGDTSPCMGELSQARRIYPCPTYTGGGGGECLEPDCNGTVRNTGSASKFRTVGYTPNHAPVNRQPCCFYSPIMIDVLGDGFRLTDYVGGVAFDINNDGLTGGTSWTRANSDDGWLALDRNGNGTIDNGAELFGNFTPQPESDEKNGFLALATFDGNADRIIDSRDAVFASLRLWQDVNHNGVSEAGELKPLPSLNVTALEIDYHESKRTDEYGNQFKYRAKVRDARGARVNRWAWDVFLIPNP